MDFGTYPPEINSARIYAGPGAGPLLAAGQAWAGLADGLYTAAAAYQSAVSQLTSGLWTGPSSASMTAAAATYLDWLSTVAAQAEETAGQATAAVAAYEAAFAMTVPPPSVAANRSLLAALAATNFLGQNTPAIAATEAQYAEMWAQDALAMYNYAASSAAATVLTPFSSPEQNTRPDAPSAQAAAVGQALATPAGNAQQAVSGFSQVPTALDSLAAPAQSSAAADSLDTLSDLITIFLGTPAALAGLGASPLAVVLGPVDLPFVINGYLVGTHTDDIVSGWNGEESWPGTAPAPVKEFPATLSNLPRGTVPTASAGLGAADTVGGLSVPSAWTVSAPEIQTRALALPLSQAGPATAAAEAASGSSVGDSALATMTGRAMAGQPNTQGSPVPQGTELRVPAKIVAATAADEPATSTRTPRIVVTGVAAKLRDITKLRDEGRLTQEEYLELKKCLLGR